MTQSTRRKRAIPLLILFLLLLLLLFLLRSWWLPVFGHFLVVADDLPEAGVGEPADAILPLAGGKERVLYAAQLYKDGAAEWFVATNQPLNLPGVQEDYGDLVRREAVWQGVPETAVLIIGETVRTTYEEAEALRELVEARDWTRVMLVTDPYHTRRARLIFNRVFADSDVVLTMYPVPDHWYDPDRWWQSVDGVRETWSEYAKFAMFWMGYHT